MIACRQLKLQGSQGFDLCHECVMALIRVRVILFLRCFGRGGLRAAARVQLLQQRGKLLGRVNDFSPDHGQHRFDVFDFFIGNGEIIAG